MRVGLRLFKPTRRRVRRALLGTLLLAVTGAAVFAGPRLYALWRTGDDIYSMDEVPARPVAIVFGARVYENGRPSAMLADRVRTAAKLYQAGKVEVLLLTGDNSIVNYNEPETMRQYALTLGVPDEALVLDYAGFRTYDSCYRARDIFQVKEAILITQEFHMPRALLLCNELGLDAVGVVAEIGPVYGYSWRSLLYSELREFPATGMAIVDLLRRPEPVLGEPLPIK